MLLSNVEIRPMIESDVDSVMKIENSSFISPWKKSDLLTELNENKYANLLVAETNSMVVGYLDYWHTFDSATICQIAIKNDYRRNGIGSLLLKELFKECYAKKVRTITLEVRKSNQNAIIFYEKHGFTKTVVKPNYYSNGEDAIYMSYEVNINE